METPGGKTRAYNAISNLTNIGKKLGVSYFMEKTEEGQQGVVSNYYRTGKYDNAGNYSLLQGAANALNWQEKHIWHTMVFTQMRI